MHTGPQTCQYVFMYAHTLHVHVCGKSIPGSGNGKCKAPEVGIMEKTGGLLSRLHPHFTDKESKAWIFRHLPKAT